MKAHIVLAHPQTKSFDGQLSDTSQRVLGAAGWQHTLSDLYAMDFDPREGPYHYSYRKDAEVFHAQTEQRFNAENETTTKNKSISIVYLIISDVLDRNRKKKLMSDITTIGLWFSLLRLT